MSEPIIQEIYSSTGYIDPDENCEIKVAFSSPPPEVKAMSRMLDKIQYNVNEIEVDDRIRNYQLSMTSEDYIHAYRAVETYEEMKELVARVNQEEFDLRKVYAKKLVIPDHPVLKERTPLLVNVYENLDAFTLRDLFDEEKKTPLMFDNSATRKPSGDCGVCSRSTFERNWSIFSEHILQSINWDHVFAAGGSVLACLLPLPPKAQKNIRCLRRYFHEEAYPGSDIDLYLYGLNEEEGK